jgi:hypothetical protein
VFTEVYDIPKADKTQSDLSAKKQNSVANLSSEQALTHTQTTGQSSATVKENSYKSIGGITSKSTQTEQNSSSGLMFFQQAHIFSNGMFYGFLLMIVLLNAFCSILFKDKAFGFFALGMTALSALIFQFDGLAALFTLNVNQSLILEIGTLWILTALLSLFAHQYLLAKDYAPKLQILSSMLMVVSLFAIGFYALLDSLLYLQIAQVIMVTLIGRYLFLGLVRAKDSGYAKIFVAGLTPFLIVFVDQLIYNQLGQSLFGLSDGLLKISAIVLVLVMTYGLLFRMQALKGEQDLRQLEMRIFMKK